MDDQGPTKHDILAVFKKLRSYPPNKTCFDCGAKNPTWASVTYGVLICIDCSAIHRGLGVHVSFVRSTQLDTNWTWLQLRAMQVGGNAAARQFFGEHSAPTTDAQQKYKTRTAQLYREKLHHAAVAAMRLHGSKLHLESEQVSPTAKEEGEGDFWETHATPDLPYNLSEASLDQDAYIGVDDDPTAQPNGVDSSKGPSTEALERRRSSNSGGAAPAPPKPTIGQRPTKKPAKGGKKGGLGAQKLSTDFSEIEQRAESLDRERQQAAVVKPSSPDAQPVKGLSARLMVQDISSERKKVEDKLRTTDPKKVDQMERLGMGFKTAQGGVSHSIATEVRSIQQEGVRNKKPTPPRGRTVDDEWEILNKEPSSKGRGGLEDLYGGAKGAESEEEEFFNASSTTTSSDNFSSWDNEYQTNRKGGGAPRKEKETVVLSGGGASSDALKKFGNAKAISSDQYFGDRPADYEARTNLARFEGSSGIGSADLFGGGGSGGSGAASSYASHVPDMADIKDSVRQGVGRVAGKLGNLSTAVHTYMSDHYGY